VGCEATFIFGWRWLFAWFWKDGERVHGLCQGGRAPIFGILLAKPDVLRPLSMQRFPQKRVFLYFPLDKSAGFWHVSLWLHSRKIQTAEHAERAEFFEKFLGDLSGLGGANRERSG